jgi:hypothetical protein
MKKITKIILLIITLFGSLFINAQTIKDVSIKTNVVGMFSIRLIFTVETGAGQIVDPDYSFDSTHMPKFKIVYSGNSNKNSKDCELKTQPNIRKNGFGCLLTGFNEQVIKQFLAKDNQITVEVDNDVEIQLIDGDGNTVQYTFKKDDINNLIKNNLSISDEERAQYISYLNNFYYYQNSLDFGIQPGKDSLSSNYFLTFQFQNRYSIKNFIACKSNPVSNTPHLFWNFSGRISTNFKDSLNYINYYPMNLAFAKYDGSVPHELNFKLGNEANQTFSNKRVVVDGAYTFIIPNLINLTTAASNRLRLKPILTAGIKGYYDYSNDATAFSSGQAYINLHYYIPVFYNYALIIEENPFFDFSRQKNPSHKVQNNYSITLGAEIPKTGFKAMFKYVNGVSNINNKQGQVIAIGLLMDFFQEKK